MRPLSAAMAMSMLVRRMKIDATVHGMRSSFRMWAADVAHAPFEVAEQCLAHVTGNAVVQAYQRSSMLERRQPLMSAWANYVCGYYNPGGVIVWCETHPEVVAETAIWDTGAAGDAGRCIGSVI